MMVESNGLGLFTSYHRMVISWPITSRPSLQLSTISASTKTIPPHSWPFGGSYNKVLAQVCTANGARAQYTILSVYGK